MIFKDTEETMNLIIKHMSKSIIRNFDYMKETKQTWNVLESDFS